MVCFSIVFSTIGTLFIHWLIIPFGKKIIFQQIARPQYFQSPTIVLYFIFSFIVFNYYQVDMAIDDRYKIQKK